METTTPETKVESEKESLETENLPIFRGISLDENLDPNRLEGYYSLNNEEALNYADNNQENVISAKINKNANVLRMVNTKEANSDSDFNEEGINQFTEILGGENVNQQDASDITEVLWGEPENIQKLKDAGIDVVIGNTIDGVAIYVVNPKAISTNETQKKGDTSTDKNLQSGTTVNQQQGKSENIQPTINNTTSKKPIEVTNKKGDIKGKFKTIKKLIVLTLQTLA